MTTSTLGRASVCFDYSSGAESQREQGSWLISGKRALLEDLGDGTDPVDAGQ